MAVRLNIVSGGSQGDQSTQCKEGWSLPDAQPSTTIDDMIGIADFLVRNEQSVLELTGAALFSHPELEFLVRYMCNRGVDLVANVNKDLRETDLDRLDSLAVLDRVRFKVDVSHLDTLSVPDLTAWRRAIGRIARRASFRLSLPHGGTSTEHLAAMYRELPLARNLEIAIRQWNPSAPQPVLEQNALLDVGAEIVALSEALAAVHVRVMMDCGTPACAFTERQLGRLVQLNAGLGFWCRPLVEFRSGDTVVPCPSLPQHATPVAAGSDLDQIRAGLREHGRAGARSDQKGIYDECNTCALRLSGRCAGGCRGYWSAPKIETGVST